MSPVSAALAAVPSLLWLGAALQQRARIKSLTVLTLSSREVAPEHVFLVRPGVIIDEATERAASQLATEKQLQALDLVSPRLSAFRLRLLLDALDPRTYRTDRTARGYTVGDALLVHRKLLDRARLDPGPPRDIADFVRIARLLKCHAVTATDVAVAPTFGSTDVSARELRSMVREAKGFEGGLVFVAQLALLTFLLLKAPIWGAAALAAFQLQTVIATYGTIFTPSDRLLDACFRVMMDTLFMFGPRTVDRSTVTAAQEQRATYDVLMARGTEHFFEQRRDDCPLCAATDLTQVLTCGDKLQGKPGHFTLSGCKSCGHIFQNPRLSIDGLSFYYKDFYDGLGRSLFDDNFSSQARFYKARAEMVTRYAQPATWLDVGAGGGHFCCYTSGLLPNTRFDGLDLNEGIEEAERRGWVRRGIRRLFPEAAGELVAQQRYDVVSMSHYLEHTLDPRAELDAAATVLEEGGLLLIELPDPESKVGRLFGSLWLPWLQPQHLHFLTAKNLERLLKERSFQPLCWHRGEAHMAQDLTFVAMLAIERIAPPVDKPWHPPASALRRVSTPLVWAALAPLVATGWLLDQLLQPLMRRTGWSNTYRVVARKTRSATSVSASPNLT